MPATPTVFEQQARIIQHIEALVMQRRLGARLQESVQQVLAQFKASSQQALTDLDGWLDLSELAATESATLGGAYQSWRTLAPGRYNAQSGGDTLRSFVHEKSPTLQALWKQSVDVLGLTRFSPEEIAFARELGEKFADWKTPWERFKSNHAKRNCLSFHRYHWRVGLDFLTFLQRHGVVESLSLAVQKKTPEGHVPLPACDRGELTRLARNLGDDDRVLLSFHGLNTKLLGLVTGTWFEAFTYWAMEDILARSGEPFDIYSRVEFEARELLVNRACSDFDVLVGLRGQIILAECKSGQLDRESVRRMVDNAQLLRRIFASLGQQAPLFLLVFSPTKAPELREELQTLRQAGYEVLEPCQLRGFLHRRLQGEPLLAEAA